MLWGARTAGQVVVHDEHVPCGGRVVHHLIVAEAGAKGVGVPRGRGWWLAEA